MASITSNVLTVGTNTISFSTNGSATTNGNVDVVDNVNIADATLATTAGNTVTLTTTDTSNTTAFTMPAASPEVGQMLACTTGGVLAWNDEQTIQLPIIFSQLDSTLDASARFVIATPTINNTNSEVSLSSNVFTLGVGIWEILFNLTYSYATSVTSNNGEFINVYDEDTSSDLSPIMQTYTCSNNTTIVGSQLVHHIVEVTSGTRAVSVRNSGGFTPDVQCTAIVRKLK